MPRPRSDLRRNPAADLLDVAAHDVHADVPAPGESEIASAVENPGRKDQIVDLASRQRVASGPTEPLLARLLEHPLGD